jgi:hypothetical protein
LKLLPWLKQATKKKMSKKHNQETQRIEINMGLNMLPYYPGWAWGLVHAQEGLRETC